MPTNFFLVMVYFVFVNPKTLQIIKNDKLSEQFSNPQKNSNGSFPGVATHLRDYDKNKDFSYLWLIYEETIERVEKYRAPLCVFMSEVNAREHFNKILNSSDDWTAGESPNKGLKIKKILV